MLASEKAFGAVVPPLTATTTGMPAPVVNPPTPPAFLIVRAVVPVAEPPLTINWSVGELLPPNIVLRVRLAPVPT